MASQIIHALEGWQAFSEAVPQIAAQLTASQKTWFYLGCQGPDIFYHSQRTAPYGIYFGSLLHRSKFNEFIIHLLTAVRESEFSLESPEILFMLGFASHGWIDSLTHPYIIYHAAWYNPAQPETKEYQYAHTFLERILDTLYWRELLHIPITCFRQAEFFIPGYSEKLIHDYNKLIAANKEHYDAIIRLLIHALSKTYHHRFLKFSEASRRIENAFIDSFHVFIKTDPFRIAALEPEQKQKELPDAGKAMLFPIEPASSIDWQNTMHKTWRNPCEPLREYTASWKDLLIEAKQCNKAMYNEIISWYLRNMNCAQLEQELPLSLFPPGTLNVGDEHGKQRSPHFCDPLPVFDELEQFSLNNY